MKKQRAWEQTWWAWGATAFLIHASVVAILLRFRGTWARQSLRIIDFWVYEWIIQRLNNERFGRPFLKAVEVLQVRTMDTVLFLWEFVILSVFGGLVYAAIAICVWLRRAHEHRVPVAA